MAGIKGRGGQKGRSGRPSKAELFGLAQLLDKCWTKQQREKCITTLAAKANQGDMDAIKLLMAYTYGKPIDRKEHTGESGNAIEVIVTHVGKPETS